MHTNEDELMNAFIGVAAVWPKHSVTQCIEVFSSINLPCSGLLSPLRRATTLIFSGIGGPSHGESRSGKTAPESVTIREEKRSEIRAERGEIQYDHDQREEIHSHCQSDRDMHPHNANQPNEPGLFHPNEKYVTKFDQTD